MAYEVRTQKDYDQLTKSKLKAVAAMISTIKDGRPGDGFVAAVELCGEQLARYFPPGALNPDELPNKVVEI